MVGSFEVERLREAGIDAHPYEEFGWDELVAKGDAARGGRPGARPARREGAGASRAPSCRAPFRSSSPTACGRTASSSRVDRDFFLQRRRVKNEAELAGIRRAQKGADEAMGAARELFRRAEPKNGAVLLDGEPLTSERVKHEILRVFGEHGLLRGRLHRLARGAERRRPRHGLGPDRAPTSRS